MLLDFEERSVNKTGFVDRQLTNRVRLRASMPKGPRMELSASSSIRRNFSVIGTLDVSA